MTMLEKIANSRVWRGCKISKVRHAGRPAYRLLHDSGAEAIIYEQAAVMQVREYGRWTIKNENERVKALLGNRRRR